jgi:hypothetical protein
VALVSQPAAQPRSCRPTLLLLAAQPSFTGLYRPAVPLAAMLLSTQQRSPLPPSSSSPRSQLAAQPSSTVLPTCSHLSPTQQPSPQPLSSATVFHPFPAQQSHSLPSSSAALLHKAVPNTQRNSFPLSSAALSHLAVHLSPYLHLLHLFSIFIFIVVFRVLFIFMIRNHYYSSEMV